MENIKPGMLFISIDGDGIGKLVGRAVLANNVEELHKVSGRIDAAQDYILHWCKQVDGIKISGGGDEATMAIPADAKESLQSLRKGIEKSFGYTISVGVGRSLSEAGTALLVAKLRGKDRIVYFNKQIKEDIKKAKRRVRENRASQEEYKLSEAYLEKAENMLCNLHKNKVCDLHKSEEGKHAPHTEPNTNDPCPYCADNEDNRTDDCPYCQQENITGIQANPEGTPPEEGAEDHHDCNCPNCPKNDQTDVAVEDMAAQRPDDCEQCQKMFGDAIENEPGQTAQEDPNLQGHETAEEVLDLLDQEPGSGAESPAQEAKKIDNTELPQGDQMRENKSVPENFGDSQKKDISDSEAQFGQKEGEEVPQDDSPDMTGVLQGGLDDHANDQKRQQTIDMVSQTLAGFKANKASLEATKEQNQPLYNSCIQMLKSMIALCDLLGLKPKATEQALQEAPPEQAPAAAPQDSSPQAAPSEGAAQDPKTRG